MSCVPLPSDTKLVLLSAAGELFTLGKGRLGLVFVLTGAICVYVYDKARHK